MNKTEEQYRANIQEFANKHKIVFDDEGETGFGRPCVGLSHGDNWVAFNPTNSTTYGHIEEFYNEKLEEIQPPNAYHKHDCLAVLGRGEEAIKQLSDWVDALKELNAEIKTYETGAEGLQALLTGLTGKCVFIPNNKNTENE